MTHEAKDGNKPKKGRCHTTREKWKQTSLSNKLLIVFTAVIAIANLTYVGFGLGQLRAMRSQLNQMQLGSRAWLGLSGHTHYPVTAGEPIRYELQFTNTGDTPANNVVINYTLLLGPKDFDLEADINRIRTEKGNSGIKSEGAVAPNGVVGVKGTSAPDVVSAPNMSAISAGQIVLYLYGRITYTDIFGVSHETSYAYVMDPFVDKFTAYSHYHSMD